jgi:hypothetical protein
VFSTDSGDARRHLVDVHRDLVVKLDQALLAILADIETDGDHRLARPRHRVDILDAIDLIEQAFEAIGNLLLDNLGAGARHLHIDVGERDNNLRFFFARRQIQCRDARDEHDQDEQHREVAAKKRRDNS